jgi:serralysin
MNSVSTIFDDVVPVARVWVSPAGDDLADGSEASPFKTIQKAVNVATPGQAIMVRAGEYRENIKLRISGTATAPIWLLSADGPQRAKLYPADPSASVIYAAGIDNFVVQGFEVIGGRYGIQFNRAGNDFSCLCHNIVVIGNLIHGTVEDGIKVSHTDNAFVIGNTIYDVAEEGIDILAVNDGVVAYNEIDGARSTAAGMFAKGGSLRVAIHHNYIHNVVADGISVGGQTGPEFFRPDQNTYEAKDCVCSDNYVEGVNENTIVCKGAVASKALNNYCLGKSGYSSNIAAICGGPVGGPAMYCSGIEIGFNILAWNSQVKFQSGNSVGSSVHDNDSKDRYTVDQWPTKTGPAAIGLAPPSRA